MTLQKPRGDDESINIWPTYVIRDNIQLTIHYTIHIQIDKQTDRQTDRRTDLQTNSKQCSNLGKNCKKGKKVTNSGILSEKFFFAIDKEKSMNM